MSGRGEKKGRSVRGDWEMRKRLLPGMEEVDPFRYAPWSSPGLELPLDRRISFAPATAGTRDGRKAVADAINKQILDAPPSSLFIFTDGSRRGAQPENFTAGAAYVIFRAGEQIAQGKRTLGP